MNAEALIIFVRKPEPGKVKTRLAASIGKTAAVDVYKTLLEHTKTVAAELLCDRYVFYAEEIVKDDLWNDGCYKRLQASSDLGGRMKTAFAALFAEGYQRVCIIGSDCFELTPAIVLQAFIGLQENELVIGPAKDGGYYLLGMTNSLKEVFADIEWSTEKVFTQTLKMIKEQGYTCSLLPTLSDVDTVDDLPEGWLAGRR